MELVLTPDQEFFAETTAKYLEDKASPTDLRALRHDPAGFSPAYWRQGAELGWTSLLVSEDDGGGSISGGGVNDLALVAHQFGRVRGTRAAAGHEPGGGRAVSPRLRRSRRPTCCRVC